MEIRDSKICRENETKKKVLLGIFGTFFFIPRKNKLR